MPSPVGGGGRPRRRGAAGQEPQQNQECERSAHAGAPTIIPAACICSESGQGLNPALQSTEALMRQIAIAFSIAASIAAGLAAQSTTPFKLGTFERNGRAFLGLVLRDTQVIDFSEANAALERRNASGPKVRMPADMKELIERYDGELRGRIAAIASDVASASSAPSYVHDVKSLKALPPVRPALILNAAANYEEHAQGIAQQQQRAGAAPAPPSNAVTAPGLWERKPGEKSDNPSLSTKYRTA